jgi:hypothetical protein
MDFLSTGKWWIFLILASLSYFISSFGHHGRGTISPKIEAIGSAIMTIFIILTFIFSGWKGGIGIIVALLIWVTIAEQIVKLLIRKLMQIHDNSLTQPFSVEELFKQSERTDEMLLTVSNQPGIIQVLRKYEKNQEDIRDIYYTLLACGVGEYVAQSIIEDPKLLSEYLQMKADEVSDLEIAYRFSEMLDKP